MLDRSLRPLKTAALAPAAGSLSTVVSATTITGLGLTVGLAAAGLAAAGLWLPALVAWIVNRLLDGLDGEIARVSGSADDRGGYLDLTADAIVYAAIPLGVAAGLGRPAAWIAAGFLLATFYVNIVTVTLLSAIWEKRALGATARSEQTSVTLPAGLIEGSETVLLFALLLAVPGLAVWTMAVMAAAVAFTALSRVAAAWPHLGPQLTGQDHRPTTEARS